MNDSEFNSQLTAFPVKAVSFFPVTPDGRYLVTVEIFDDLDVPAFERVTLEHLRALGVPAANVRFLYTQDSGVLFTQEVKPPEPVKKNHRG